MQIAAEAGIAPRIHYLNADDRVVMMDFIEDRPLETYPGGPQALAQAVGAMLKKLQALPLFPASWIIRTWWTGYGSMFAEQVCLPMACSMWLRKGWSNCARPTRLMRENYVSSHNHFLPRNLLFDGKRLWLIDWENAFRNDPLVDLATALDNFSPSPELEEVLLHVWPGKRGSASARPIGAGAFPYAPFLTPVCCSAPPHPPDMQG